MPWPHDVTWLSVIMVLDVQAKMVLVLFFFYNEGLQLIAQSGNKTGKYESNFDVS